ncbi:MAG: YggU family protein [Betaproteobacteria bacterium]|nr:YggU family protein [Betaproteobacteria bacterium]
MRDWYRVAGDGRITLTLHIQPGAKKTEFAGLHGDALKIRLAAPPVDGKANDALVKFVADTLGLAKSAVSLKSGQTSRRKVLEVTGAPPSVIAALATPST